MSIPTRRLTALRGRVVARYLPDTCIIKSKSFSSDGAGGYTQSLNAAGTVACRVDPIEWREKDVRRARRDTLSIIYTLTVPYDAPLTATSVVEYGGEDYEVVDISDDHSQKLVKRARMSRDASHLP